MMTRTDFGRVAHTCNETNSIVISNIDFRNDQYDYNTI